MKQLKSMQLHLTDICVVQMGTDASCVRVLCYKGHVKTPFMYQYRLLTRVSLLLINYIFLKMIVKRCVLNENHRYVRNCLFWVELALYSQRRLDHQKKINIKQ